DLATNSSFHRPGDTARIIDFSAMAFPSPLEGEGGRFGRMRGMSRTRQVRNGVRSLTSVTSPSPPAPLPPGERGEMRFSGRPGPLAGRMRKRRTEGMQPFGFRTMIRKPRGRIRGAFESAGDVRSARGPRRRGDGEQIRLVDDEGRCGDADGL